MEYKRHPERIVNHFIAGPIVYALIVPLILLDISLEIFHRLCFPLYGIPRLARSRYFQFDRHKLRYLTWWEKINCTYCTYANGLLLYASMIADATEQYWCSIKNKKDSTHVEPPYHTDFLEYDDEKEFRAFLERK
jgi:hypothetical protein